ncbi:unnamed protein product [Adineta steineri]|uniref:Uncharacterized protein n=1 Tax=Adineta steineri TaxID=433720 RepID=A0A819QXU9_9BILA|nr:unnamed protein product [Adineta steineri]CAF4032798.1 unnamed protein product [Adineta steineri]
MKFNRKLQKTIILKRSSHHSRKKLSNHNLSIQIHNIKNFKKKFRFSFIKNFIWHKKTHISTTKLPLISSLSSPRIEELQNEFMNVLREMCNKSEIQKYQQKKYSILSNLLNINHFSKEIIQEYNLYHQTESHTHNRLLTTRSVDNFTSKSIEHYLYSSLSSEPIHQSFLRNIIKRTNNSLIKIPLKSKVNKRNSSLNISIKSESCLKKPNSLPHSKLSLKSASEQQQEAAIIDIEYPSLNSIKPLEKSYSSPLPIKTNHLSFSNNYIQSAHIINQYENKSKISLYSSINEMESDESMESISSDEDNVKHSLLKYQENIHMKNLRHRWSLFDVWRKTMTKLPSTLNCIWRERLYHTGSREFCEF